MLATLGGLLRDLDIGAQLAACGQNLGAQLFADFGDQASENIAPEFIASGNRAFDPGVYKPRPVLRTLHFDLGNGRLVRDHTVLPYATSAVRLARCCSLTETALPTTLARRRCRVHRIPSRVCDDRDTPLLPGKDGAS
jgi:hypothetical protein